MSETNGTVTNILQAVDFNEELAREVNARIEDVAARVARNITSQVAEGLAQHYIEQHAEALVEEMVRRQVSNAASIATKAAIQEFMNSDQYLHRHQQTVKAMATLAVQEHNRSVLRLLTGSYNI